jgi:type IV pilus assembly protein PilY1
MFSIDPRARHVAISCVLTLLAAGPSFADDTEIYQSQAAATGAQPNVLFVIDTSGSMNTTVPSTIPAYNPALTYTGSCDDQYLYWSSGTNGAPKCSTSQYIARTSMTCNAASNALATHGSGQWPFGAAVQMAQYRSSSGTYKWRSISSGNSTNYVECAADDGTHGQTTASTSKYINNGGSSTTGWGTTNKSLWGNIGNTYRFYTANYLNYLYGSAATDSLTRLEVVRDVAINLANSLDKVNLGLMRYSSDAQGGYVLQPVKDIASNRQAVIDELNKFQKGDGINGTPLSETYYEAARYYKGAEWDYGSKSSPAKSISTSIDSNNNYISPAQYSCQKNFIVYLTDGAPTVDDDANDKIATMIGKSCAADTSPPYHDNGWTAGSGICMDDLAAWLSNQDTDLRSTVNGNQTVQTYMIGFGDDVGASKDYLDMIARAGGTTAAHTAKDVPTLTNELETIFSDIQTDSATFITPSISVNAYNRAQTESDLFFSLFKVGNRTHWDGNLKKYKLSNDASPVIQDSAGQPAVDSDGFFAKTAVSFWTSPDTDGNDITLGGAVRNLPKPDTRKIYTSLASGDLWKSENALVSSNPLITDATVGTGSTTLCSDSTACQDVINWARGLDVDDKNGNKDFTDQVKFMGDPMHGRPAVVSYGKLANGENDTTVFFPTNDGFLHAIQGTTTASGSGVEKWAFIPTSLLPRLATVRANTPVVKRTYGLDGDIRVLRLDKNGDGTIDASAGDRVWLFFGQRGGGDHYFGLDVTNRDQPKLLWDIGSTELPGVGQTWSPPVVTRVTVGTANTDPEKFVLIFGGGYDRTQETQSYSTDTIGNRIFMVEASTGKLLWYAGGTVTNTNGTPNLALDAAGKAMDNSIPARITVIDTNGDLFADRMYAADMGGRIWRFDIFNGNAASSLVTGGVIAKLGAAGVSGATDKDARRFYNAPDVSLIKLRGEEPFYNIAIGSGYRGHPMNTTTEERFYSVRDASPYAMLTQDDYDKNVVPILDSDLVDISTDPAGTPVPKTAKGWKLNMKASGSFVGEKVLAESTTVNNTILFTSFEPVTLGGLGPCYPSTINRAYAVTAFGGKPALDFNDDKTIDNKDLYVKLKQQGIVGDINVALLRQGGDTTDPTSPPTICLAGMEVLKKCVAVGGTVRTFWNRTDAK